MASSPSPGWRGGRVSTACVACHRLKMKCVRVGDTPCARCQRAMRACYSRQSIYSDRLEVVLKTPESFSTPNQSQPSSRARRRRESSKPCNRKSMPADCDGHLVRLRPNSKSLDALPPIYSTAPFLAVLGGSVAEQAVDTDPCLAHSPEALLITPPNDVVSNGTSTCISGAGLPKAEMRQLLKIFCTRLLHSIPVFTKDDFDEPELLIKHQPELLYAICYVTSRYLPGGLPTIRLVYPHVLRFLQDKSTDVSWAGSANIGSFRALMILYAFSEATLPNLQSPHSPYMLPTPLVKSVTEMYGTQLGLHRSIDSVKTKLSLPHDQWLSSASYKRYTYWLWLFTMSHHSALITRTPPSIRSDYSIRSAPELFASINIDPRMRRLLGEVELCLLWEKANTLDSGLSEWWCPSQVPVTPQSSPSATVAIATHDLAEWKAKYAPFIEHGGFGIGLDFHHRFSQFCLSAHAACHYAQVGNTSERDLLTKTTLDHAVGILSWLQHLNPVAQESLRYISDFAFIMLLFACMFILQACESRCMVPEERHRKLNMVSTTAQLLVELGSHPFHFPSVYGKSLQKRLGNFQRNEDENTKMKEQTNDSSLEALNIWAEYQSSVNASLSYQSELGDAEILFDELFNMPIPSWYDALQ